MNTILRISVAGMLLAGMLAPASLNARKKDAQPQSTAMESQWKGKKIAFLGDSITDSLLNVRTETKGYYSILQEQLGIIPYDFAVNGWNMGQLPTELERLQAAHGDDVDAILVFIGTNDFNGAVPIGEWWEESVVEFADTGEKRLHRSLIYGNDTFKARINKAMRALKEAYPYKQIILLTPIHRAYFCGNAKNIQPDESYANKIGRYIDDYVAAIKEAGNIWAVPVIDMNSLSGLYPLCEAHRVYFRDAEKDRLHMGSRGHARFAETLKWQLLALPGSFD